MMFCNILNKRSTIVWERAVNNTTYCRSIGLELTIDGFLTLTENGKGKDLAANQQRLSHKARTAAKRDETSSADCCGCQRTTRTTQETSRPVAPLGSTPEVQPQVGTTEKSAPKISRVSTKKRRAPPAPPIVVPISIEDAPKEERKTETPNDETDAPVVVDGSNQGVPPSPAVSHGSSQDKDSIIGSVSEQDSADVEGSETSSVNPDRRSMTEDVEEPIESSSSKDDDSTQGQDIVIVTSSAASAEGGGGEGGGGGKENEGKEIEGEVFQVSTSGDGEADNIVGALDASKGGTSTTESEKDQDSKEVVKVSDSREGIENREDVSGNDLQTDEVHGGSDPRSEESRRNVCKCIDPENGEECDHMPTADDGTGPSSCGGHDRPSEDGNDNEAVTSPETTAEDDVKGGKTAADLYDEL
ncbi:hypothetical protein BSL78_13537 [Apostichopus japonicus]|uniref:Uncharacterized protein n=1 Tax=Stichopus japonicus TaxID=307972 RepID=A0A2G8KNL9_STIJA|nr:hypothetical protein BSL78_13537 [Apostichopus japonicus]